MSERLTSARLNEIRLLADALPVIEYRRITSAFGHENSIAELGADGKWVRWDMRCCLSDASCDFLALGKRAVYDLLTYIEELARELAAARQQRDGSEASE